MFPVHGHAAPAPLAVLLVLHDEVAAEVLDAPALAADAGVDHLQRRAVAEVEVFSVPRPGEETLRSVACNNKTSVSVDIFGISEYNRHRGQVRIIMWTPATKYKH